ncbi:MAG: permease prefix domain 1-containing protein, partial [Longimicrobiales bacterium]
MMRWRELGTRLRGSVRRGSGEREMEDEMRFHLDMATERNLRLGLSPEEARRRAHLVFGDGERFKEEGRDALRVRAVENVLRDVQYGLRSLRRLPAFTTVAVLTLALAIGANTAIFSVAKAVLLEPLPFPNADRLVHIG